MRVWVLESDLRCMSDAQEQQMGAVVVHVNLIEPDASDERKWRFFELHVSKKGN